jgi:DNA polymerase-4
MSHKVMERLENLSPLVEQISIDEAFVDISDIRTESAERIARRLQQQINTELTLPCSIGIASNKLVAKLATEVGKKSKRPKPTSGDVGLQNNYPNALTIVPAGQEADFLAPLPVDMLWGVGPKTGKRLGELGIHTIGALAAWPESDLIARFGENGRDLARHARGLDDRSVETERETKSISQETTFARDVRDDKVLEKTLKELAAEVARQLRKENLAGKTVKLKLRWPDFTTLTRQITLSGPTDQDDEIAETAIQLLRKVREPGAFVRLIGVGVSGLGAPVRQLGLWDTGSEKARKLQEVLDALQEKYGSDVVKRGKE